MTEKENHNPKEQDVVDCRVLKSPPADVCAKCGKINPTKFIEGCGKYLGYRHLSGNKSYCGDDVVTHIVYCDKCRKKFCSCKKFQPKEVEKIK